MNQSRRLLALAGVLVGIAGLVTSQATVWLFKASNGPVSAVADAVGDLLAGGPAMDLGHLVGPTWDKRLLVMGVVAFLVGASAWLGTLAGRRPVLVDVAYFALAAIGFVSVTRLPNSSSASLVGVVVGLITWMVAYRVLTAPLLADKGPDDGAADEATRRQFLKRAGITVGVVAGAGLLGGFSSRKVREVQKARRALNLAAGKGAVPDGVELGVRGVAPWRTPNEEFYLIDTAFSKPAIAPDEWRLRIHGMVENEITLTYDDLIKRARTEDWITICCVSNEVGGDLIGNAYWSGFLIRDILAEAGIKEGATAVKQTSDDGWTCGTPIEALTDDRNAMLAVAMNGEPLPIEHGFPVRMIVPGLYGFVSATKWLVDLEVTTFDDFSAYWTDRGWSAEGPVLTQSRIDVPRNGEETERGTVRIGGSAWAQHTGIEKVEFQVDGGSWQQADLGTVPDLDTWVQWSGTAEVGKGRHQVVVRATDRSGYTQTSVRTDVIPSGATGWHSIEFEAR
ncbi:molybdopterin-dependent oxidoreductase [Marmoricola sp. OAE513]|uniref:molybdopterin-dependent oxidoreductase n=1 Tax=Marmoricola sp. OAE513 TaxID=2817894 RepID=UPI001AE67738